MDSTALLYYLLNQKYNVKALSINYGQRHSKELLAAATICRQLNVPHEVADLTSITKLIGGSSLTDSAITVPEGHYNDENMKITVVPNRNMIMLSIAIGHAIALKYDEVAYAAHSGDHAIYPDCRPAFVAAMNQVAGLCDWHPVKILTPFINMDKGDIAKLGDGLKVPFELTWTCYQGRKKHCGKCGACQERREAFFKHSLIDPTEYEER
jgi:7-cyano-7-deazaguanine synthase